MSWNRKNAQTRIEAAVEQTSGVVVEELTSLGQLDNIGQKEAWRIHAVHAYVEILNAPDLLDSEASGNETERSHKRLLRFLHVYQRVAHLVFQEAPGARRVDFQNQRLHFLVGEPMDDEATRIQTAVALADALQRVITNSNVLHQELPDARIRVGIDSGVALAVRNGTRGDREPLFLGNPANQAAKLLKGGKRGIYLSETARACLGEDFYTPDPRTTPLTVGQISACVDGADLGLDIDALVEKWEEEVKATPLSEFKFSRPKPPLKDLDLDELTPGNSRRIEASAIYADIDGFTRFVADRIGRQWGEAEAVQVLHVIRKELRDVLLDFGGRKIRYNGDCLVGVLAEGETATDQALTMSRAALCAGALRSSFELIQELMAAAAGLGLAIGLDGGPIAITRLGPKGTRFRCIVGRAVVESEALQQVCDGKETGLAKGGFAWANQAVRDLLPEGKPTRDITYNRVYAALDAKSDRAAPALSGLLGIDSIRPRAFGGQ